MIYIHIPFCKQICHYCDFFHSGSLRLVAPVMEGMLREMELRAGYLTDVPRTIYFGGGTPSAVSLDYIEQFFVLAQQLWGISCFEEATIEVNPDDVTVEFAGRLRDIGFNRVSLGVQSFVDEHLRLMNRRHTGMEAEQAVRILQSEGFDNITIDLIYAMPFLTDEQWSDNLDRAVALNVQHISAYHLTIEERTAFGKRGMKSVSDEVSERHFEMLRERLIGAGFEHYEVSNFAKHGFRSRHNSGYWQGKPYLGIGPSAHSFNGKERSWNVSSNPQYIKGVKADVEVLTATDIYNERLMTRLRTADGLLNPDKELIERAADCIESGDLILGNISDDMKVLRIPSERFLISDFIISELFICE